MDHSVDDSLSALGSLDPLHMMRIHCVSISSSCINPSDSVGLHMKILALAASSHCSNCLTSFKRTAAGASDCAPDFLGSCYRYR